MGIVAHGSSSASRRLARQSADPRQTITGLFLTCLIGIAGALGDGRVASHVFHLHNRNGFLYLSTWLTGIAGSAVLLLAYHLATGQSGHRTAHR